MSILTDELSVEASDLINVVARIFVACGLPEQDAVIASTDLVAADLEDVASHGVMLVPMYVKRLKAGSVSSRSAGEVVVDNGAAVVIDAHHALGQLVARQAVELAVARAKTFGAGIVAVRNAFHFGTAGRYARLIAAEGCIGLVTSNTRPLMPAPGGAEPITGNNPLAVAVPSQGEFLPEVDMALSASAMGKIRIAAAQKQSIPPGWAADKDGVPTIDAEQAISGMLLPAAGPKGFGLAFMLDLLAGGLASGAIGPEVRPLYGDASQHYRSSQLFVAINTGHFLPETMFALRAKEETDRVTRSRRSPGVERVFAPGEMAHNARLRNGNRVKLSASTLSGLQDAAGAAGVELPEFQ